MYINIQILPAFKLIGNFVGGFERSSSFSSMMAILVTISCHVFKLIFLPKNIELTGS
jgi:hypothetical protein